MDDEVGITEDQMNDISRRLTQDWNTKTKGRGPVRELLHYRCGTDVWAMLQGLPQVGAFSSERKTARAVLDESLAPQEFISTFSERETRWPM